MKEKIKKFMNNPYTRIVVNEIIVGVVSYGITTAVIWGLGYLGGKVVEHFNPGLESELQEI